MSFSLSPVRQDISDAQDLAAWTLEKGTPPVLPLCVAAAWAYADEPTFETVMTRRGLSARKARFVDVRNDAMFVCAQAYIQPVGDGAIIAFRGTDPTSVITWLADATLESVAFHAPEAGGSPNGLVHSGFYRNTRAVFPDVLDEIAAMDPPPKWIYLTGHSFGGSLAVLAGALLADYESRGKFGDLWEKVKGIVTFGQPMVGDAKFAGKYAGSVGKKLFRYVYARDIVPHLPPETSGLDPVHLGTEYRDRKDAGWVKAVAASNPITAIIPDMLIGVAAWLNDEVPMFPKFLLRYSWGDHAPNNYVRVSLPHGALSGSEFD